MPLSAHQYYSQHYPWAELVALLTCNGDELCNCEFAIEATSDSGHDYYKRYVWAHTAEELRAKVIRHTGIRALHFGAFYSAPPNKTDIDAGKSVATRRVLSFDVDLTDMEQLKLSGSDANEALSITACDKHWPVSAMAAFILRRMLERAFGYTKLLIVYSGRRGVHVHVFDNAAMNLDDEARAAVTSYIHCNMDKVGKKAPDGVRLIMDMHDMRREVWRSFNDFVVSEKAINLFDNADDRTQFWKRHGFDKYEKWDKYVNTLNGLVGEMVAQRTGKDAWKLLEQRIRDSKIDWLINNLECSVLAYVWPRLDANVTKDAKHLTKVPFASHGKSRRVAVAIHTDRRSIFTFNPAVDAPSLDHWDPELMAAAVGRFCVKATSRQDDDNAEPPEHTEPAEPMEVDIEDLVEDKQQRQQVRERRRKWARIATCTLGMTYTPEQTDRILKRLDLDAPVGGSSEASSDSEAAEQQGGAGAN